MCQKVKPSLEKLSLEQEGIKFYYVDVTDEGLDALKDELGVGALPSFAIHDAQGQHLETLVGLQGSKDLAPTLEGIVKK